MRVLIFIMSQALSLSVYSHTDLKEKPSSNLLKESFWIDSTPLIKKVEHTKVNPSLFCNDEKTVYNLQRKWHLARQDEEYSSQPTKLCNNNHSNEIYCSHKREYGRKLYSKTAREKSNESLPNASIREERCWSSDSQNTVQLKISNPKNVTRHFEFDSVESAK